MIANISKRPFLQIGKYCVTAYDEAWLSAAFDKAAKTMGGDVSAFRQDIMAGIVYYLEEVCTQRIISIDELFQRIRQMLRNVGLHPLAANLERSTPTISIDLKEIADDCPIPLFFFHNLQKELEDLKNSGIESCAFSHIRECAMSLERARRWSRHCEQTANEIRSLIISSWKSQSTQVA